MFAVEKDPTKAMDRHLFDHWLAYAERKAELPKLAGGLWHPYRRKLGDRTETLLDRRCGGAGGRRDTATLLTCYTQPDNETLLAVISERFERYRLASPGRAFHGLARRARSPSCHPNEIALVGIVVPLAKPEVSPVAATRHLALVRLPT